MRITIWLVIVALAPGCGSDSRPAPDSRTAAQAPADAQHKGVTGPHGDHTPHHGGLVLMNGDVHYEVVLAADGRHQLWFSDALRNELPASIASDVTFEVARPNERIESVRLAIDEAGEAWIASARPLAEEGTIVKVRYALQGTPHEIEVPYVRPQEPGARPQ